MGLSSAREFIDGIDVRKNGFEVATQKVVKNIKIRLAVKAVFVIKCCGCSREKCNELVDRKKIIHRLSIGSLLPFGLKTQSDKGCRKGCRLVTGVPLGKLRRVLRATPSLECLKTQASKQPSGLPPGNNRSKIRAPPS